ncbi:MAG: serine/threonine-protein phosphatase [Lachnospiraceae bacterium]|nr:serine/threonine-protein phosphatase [Lachnospiraceae bacterium]
MITYKIHTHVGNREVNEDSVGEHMSDGRYCFVLADGLGGHGSGECASFAAVKTVLELFAEQYNEEFLDGCFTLAQARVLEEQILDKSKSDMKTTLVTLVIDKDKVRWGHIGDSRLYHFYKNKVASRTLDHSVPQMLVNLGEIKEKDIRGHEDRNRLLRVIGTPWNNHSYELSDTVQAKKCQAFLLCSDGFWELIDEKAMITYLKKAKTVDEWMDLMVKEVMANGKDVNMDNNSAIAIWMEG